MFLCQRRGILEKKKKKNKASALLIIDPANRKQQQTVAGVPEGRLAGRNIFCVFAAYLAGMLFSSLKASFFVSV